MLNIPYRTTLSCHQSMIDERLLDHSMTQFTSQWIPRERIDLKRTRSFGPWAGEEDDVRLMAAIEIAGVLTTVMSHYARDDMMYMPQSK